MSVIILLPNGTDWFKANWVFRQLAEDVSNRYRNDDGVCKTLELAQAFGSLDMEIMDEGLRCKVMHAVKTVAEETVSGTIEGWRPDDRRGHAMYCEALSELAKLIEQQQNARFHKDPPRRTPPTLSPCD
jgi:hypothetical protein